MEDLHLDQDGTDMPEPPAAHTFADGLAANDSALESDPGAGLLGTSDASYWEPAAPVADCGCPPASADETQAVAATLGFPEPGGVLTQMAGEDTNGDGVVDRVSLDFNQDGVADAWAFDADGSGQATTLLIDTTGDGLADAVSYWDGTGWTQATALPGEPAATTPGPAPAPAAVADPAAATPLPVATPAAIAPLPLSSPTPFEQAMDSDRDGDGKADAIDAYPDERYDSPSADRDNDGTADAFDREPTHAFDSSTKDRDNDYTPDRFDSSPTRAFDSSSRDYDDDGEKDFMDSSPTNPDND